MKQVPIVLGLIVLLLMPAYISAQSPNRITLLDNFGTYDAGEPLFIYGQVANIVDDSFLIMQIINPHGDLCQIQQLSPLPNGVFLTDVIPLKGRICGIIGQYEVKLFYGDHTQSATFDVSIDIFSDFNDEQQFSLAQNLVSDHETLIDELFGVSSTSSQTLTSISELETVYVNLWEEFFADELLFEISPIIRPAIISSLDSVQQLLDDDEISFETAKSIDKMIFAAIFYYEIDDKTRAIGLLTDAFVDIRNLNPEKTTQRALTFDELEETLLNLMKKSDTVMSRDVKEQVAFIFARGTAPIYVDEIAGLVDILSESRYIDVISRKQSDLYKLVQNKWESLKPSLQEILTIEELLASSTDVSELYQAAILLRELDDVERFISSDSEENSRLVNLLIPDWEDLGSDLARVNSIEGILESESKIRQMSQIIDISSRISKSVEISQSNGVNSRVISGWESLLQRVESARSVEEILEIVSEFDQTITELREKRNPLTVLEFEYKSMKGRAEIQADYENLFLIDNALKILKTAKQMESGNPSITRIDRIEVLLTWVSEIAPKIRADLDAYNKDAFKIRANDILQRAKSLENLVELSLTKNKFLPNYIEFTEKLNEKIDDARDLVINNDLEQADILVRELLDEWNLVSKAYTDDPGGSKIGYTVDEIKRIDFRKKLEAYSDMVTNFYNNGFSEHSSGYNKLVDEAYELIEIANFIDAESKITEIGDYLSEHLVLKADDIIYDITFDPIKKIWVLQGTTKKDRFDYREDLFVTIYRMDGSIHSSLEFTDTRQGNFYTQWVAPTESGLYVVSLVYLESQATQIVHVEERLDTIYNAADLNTANLAREFNELKTFAERFGGDNFDTNQRFSSLIYEIKLGFNNKNTDSISKNLSELRTSIERYLPIRNPAAPIEATFDGEKLVISGRVLKIVEFSEDLFIDIYDQRGKPVKSIALKDDPTGLFNEVLRQSFDSGVYVVQLEYHDIVVTDFFNVK